MLFMCEAFAAMVAQYRFDVRFITCALYNIRRMSWVRTTHTPEKRSWLKPRRGSAGLGSWSFLVLWNFWLGVLDENN